MRGEMTLAAADRTPAMTAAHGNADVTTVATRFLLYPLDGMVRLLTAALTSPTDPVRHRGMVLTAQLPTKAQEAAFELLEAANRLWPLVDGTFCRGAVLEKVTRGLLDGRGRPILEEQRVGPFDGSWWREGMSDPIDFVLPDRPEFYECKANIKNVESRHTNQFVLIQMLDPASLTAFVTLQRAATVIDWLGEFPVERPIHAFTLEDFLSLAEGPAQQVVAG
jgi:hypothetical protein